MTRAVKKGHRLVPCDGEAHSNAHIDHCMQCAPRWGEVEIPERFATLDEYREHCMQEREKQNKARP